MNVAIALAIAALLVWMGICMWIDIEDVVRRADEEQS